MKTFPIVPIWLMLIICISLLFLLIKNKRKDWKLYSIIALLFLINLRIMYPTNNVKILSNNLDVLFVIDTTISMKAEDYDGKNTRLYGVKKDCQYIINRLNGARFSVITFNNTANIMIPYTKDTSMTIQSIDIIQPTNHFYAEGTSLNIPIETMLYSLQSSEKKDDRTRILFFISDGEITDKSTLNSYKKISKYIKNGAVLGYGTTKGGYMKEHDIFTDKEEYIIDMSDFKNEKAISKIDENNLKKIASDINIDYINMNENNNIDKKLKEIEKLINTSFETSDKSSYEDTYSFLVIPLLILFVIQITKYKGIKL